jgi:zinc and cadmium transporter
MSYWASSLLAVFGISLISGVGAITLYLKRTVLENALVVLIPFAAGALLGDAFLHVIPEIAESESGFDVTASYSLLVGVLAFFLLEKVLHWHHAHVPTREVIHPVAASNLVGDALHNFLDGAIVAGSFVVSPQLGIATTIAVAMHEIPQELGDFSILVFAGLKPRRALILNFASGLVAMVGAIVALTIASTGDLERLLVPFSAGAFIYIASTDLLPELHKEPEPGKSAIQAVAMLAGVLVMGSLLWLE